MLAEPASRVASICPAAGPEPVRRACRASAAVSPSDWRNAARSRGPPRPRLKPRQGPLDIGAMAQALAQCQARVVSIDIELDRIEPVVDRGALGQWCREMIGQQSRARRGDGAVDRRQQASAALPGAARHQFEIAPGRGVDLHDRAGHDPPRRFEMWRLSLLGQADIIDQCARRGDLGAAEIAKAVERADPVEVFEPAAGRVAVEAGVGQRGQDRLPFGQHLEQRRAGQQPLGQQDLARRKAGEIAGQGGLARSAPAQRRRSTDRARRDRFLRRPRPARRDNCGGGRRAARPRSRCRR